MLNVKRIAVLVLILVTTCLSPLYAASRETRARALFQEAMAIKGHDRASLRHQARLFEKALSIQPEFWEAAINLVQVYLNLEEPDKALPWARKARELRPDERLSVLGLCQALRLSDHLDEAAECLDAALKQFPGDNTIAGDLVWVRYRLGQWDRAVRVIRENSGLMADSQLRRIYMMCLLELKHWDAARSLLAEQGGEWQKEDPGFYAECLVRLGRGTGRNSLVIRACLEALAHPLTGQEQQFFLGTLAELGLELPIGDELRRVYQQFQDSIQTDNSLAIRWARALAVSGAVTESGQLIDTILGRMAAPEVPEVVYSLKAALLARQGQFAAEADMARRGLQVYPDSVELAFRLGDSLVRSQHFAEAIGPLQQVLRSRPEDRSALDDLRVACLKADQPAAAVDAFESYLARKPDDDEMLFNFSLILCRTGDAERALTSLERAVRHNPGKWVPVLEKEIQAIHSPFDCIRYRARFNELLSLKKK